MQKYGKAIITPCANRNFTSSRVKTLINFIYAVLTLHDIMHVLMQNNTDLEFVV